MSTPSNSQPSTDEEKILRAIMRADIAVLRQRAMENSRVADDDVNPALRGYARQAAIRRKAS
jgi:hypothetical protein